MDRKKTSQSKISSNEFFDEIWEQSWTYIKTIVDVLREPIIILDKNLCVLAANEPFYRTFQVDSNVTEGTLIYELGNGQWDIPDLRRLLEDILPHNTFFKNFQVSHEFPYIGKKIMILNAKQIHYQRKNSDQACPPIILLAMEDITDMIKVAESFTDHTRNIEEKFSKRAENFEKELLKLQKELAAFRK